MNTNNKESHCLNYLTITGTASLPFQTLLALIVVDLAVGVLVKGQFQLGLQVGKFKREAHPVWNFPFLLEHVVDEIAE
jgi:uncharacterized membrane protein YciS (DUF1049 family)